MVHSKVLAAGATGLAQHALKVGRSFDAADHGLDAARLDGQALAALGATGADHGAATAGLHADEEAVGAGAAGLGALVGAFHVGKPLWTSVDAIADGPIKDAGASRNCKPPPP